MTIPNVFEVYISMQLFVAVNLYFVFCLKVVQVMYLQNLIISFPDQVQMICQIWVRWHIAECWF